MTKKETRVLASITFKADKMLAKMKKCVAKRNLRNPSIEYPAIDMESGLLVTTHGFVLAAHKLKDFESEVYDADCICGKLKATCVSVPREVLQMKGTVVVTVTVGSLPVPASMDPDDDGTTHWAEQECICIKVTDETGAVATVYQEKPYPNWRSVFPGMTGWPIDINAKAWDKAVKELMPKIEKMGDVQPIHLFADVKSTTLKFSYDNDYPDGQGSTTVAIDEMPYRMGVGFNAIHLRDVLAFEPNTLRFTDNTRAVIFHNDETVLLIMPLNIDIDGKPMVEVPKREREAFRLTEWIGETAAVAQQQTQPATPIELAERLRQLLLARLAA